MIDIEKKEPVEISDMFLKSELVPAVIQNASTGEVLMLAYMNKESLELTVKTGLCTFFSRSRQKLWVKGETSGNLQHVCEIFCDCDCDTLLIKVNPDGAACHTGNVSCFYRKINY